MIGIPSHIPHEPPSSFHFAFGLTLLGAAFLAFFAGLAVLDSGRNGLGLTLLGVFAALVVGSSSTVLKKR
jgi:hypothetical protein